MPRLEDMDDISAEEYAARVSDAAVSFANDYGPLPAANAGGVEGDIAKARMGKMLLEVLQANGLTATPI